MACLEAGRTDCTNLDDRAVAPVVEALDVAPPAHDDTTGASRQSKGRVSYRTLTEWKHTLAKLLRLETER